MTKATVPLLALALVLSLTAAGCSSRSGSSSWNPFSSSPQQQAVVKPAQESTWDKVSAGAKSFGNSVASAFKPASTKSPSAVKPAAHAEVESIALNAKSGPPTAEFHVGLAQAQERMGNQQNALTQYDRALALEPKNLKAKLGKARLYDRQGQYDKATELYLQVTKEHPREPAAFNDLGLCYARQKRFDQAVTALERAVQLQPDKSLYRNNIATVLVELGRTDEALRHLSAVHGEAIAHYNVGFLLNKRGQIRQARDQFALAAGRDANFEDARLWAENLSRALGETELPAPRNVAQSPPPSEQAPPAVRTAPKIEPASRRNVVSALPEPVEPELSPADRHETGVGQPAPGGYRDDLVGERYRSRPATGVGAATGWQTPADSPAQPARGGPALGGPDLKSTPTDTTSNELLQPLPPVSPRDYAPSRY